MTARAQTAARRGGSLLMLALVLGGWTSARAVWWESPFPMPREVLPPLLSAAPVAKPPVIRLTDALPTRAEGAMLRVTFAPMAIRRAAPAALATRPPSLAAASRALHRGTSGATPIVPEPAARNNPPFLPPASTAEPPSPAARPRRWSVDAWAFWRQGSDSAPISQGRVPIYGASQVGGVLQYRLAPQSGHDPRLFARAYRSLVRRGESEVSLGASARPLARVPIRVAAEVRYTDAAFTTEWRPAVFAVTELPPLALPYGVQAEAYAQGGWVGGQSETPFADAQASVTRDLGLVARRTDNRLRLSLGAGAWGGVQRDAERIDVGPTLRLDAKLGGVPARLTVDWRERVAGGAGPESGVAATLSTHF
jgi:hypothetical protein